MAFTLGRRKQKFTANCQLLRFCSRPHRGQTSDNPIDIRRQYRAQRGRCGWRLVEDLIKEPCRRFSLEGQDFLEPYIQLLSPLFWCTAQEEIRSRLDRALPTVREHPYRVLANSLALHSYRNGPIENIHAGRGGRFSLNHRRVTEAESRTILQFTSRHLAPVIASFRPWEDEPDHPIAWPDKLAGIYISPFLTSRSWTLTEESSSVRLPLDSQT